MEKFDENKRRGEKKMSWEVKRERGEEEREDGKMKVKNDESRG